MRIPGWEEAVKRGGRYTFPADSYSTAIPRLNEPHGPQTAHQARPRLPETGDPVLRHHHAAAGPGRPQDDDRPLSAPYVGQGIDVVIGIESRGFILGAAGGRAHRRGVHPDPEAGEAAGEVDQGDRTTWSTGRTRSRSTRTRSRKGSGSSSWTTCWRRAGPRPRRPGSSRSLAASSTGWRS